MKRIKIITILMVLFCGTALSAKDFDWSECWCNYGGGIQQGDCIVNASAGLWFRDFEYAVYNNFMFIPPVMVEVQFAQPIWKLPFTFGGYAGMRGYSYKINEDEYRYLIVFCGGEAAYHIQLPPKGLDLYAVTRVGVNIPFVRPGQEWNPDFFQFGEALGANWFFNEFFGLNLEFGFPFSKFGVSFQF